ncbi:MAG: Uncharacterised protein [Flavobacterium sp. SCGC AAA160-P02]|nr:MAG: Uncharacterised protein [Flavobacterium sp. SCGC AAA160-P02]|tara:strand:- start:959 stop:1378 length:420 start_codon:yes stop_codon:yes gene_type:complete
MEYHKIISISKKPGLFQIISQTKSGCIVESFQDKKRFPVHSMNQISLLENIAIFTYESEIPLLEVFKSIFKKTEGKMTISHKESGSTLAAYFSEVLPEYDQERVYISNIKKVLQWYNILIKVGLDFSKIEASKENAEDV